MNSPTEISSSTQLFLAEMHKLFDEQAAKWDRRFAEMDAAWNRRVVSQSSSVRTPTAAIGADVAADDWGGLFDGGDTPDGLDLLAPSATNFVAPVTAPSAATLPTDFVAHAEQERRAAIDHSAHFLADTPTLLSARAPTTEHIYPDLNVDRMGEQSYWCYADPRCSVPLLGHRPSCGRPPPEQHGADAADPTRLDPSTPPPLLLDTGDPMPPCLAPPPPQPPAVKARWSRLTTAAPFPVCTAEMGLVSTALSADIGLQQVTKVLAGSIPTQAAADGSDINDTLAFSLHLVASMHVFPTPHQPQLATEATRWTAPPSVGVDPSAISTTADTVKLLSTFVGSCLDVRVPLSKFTSPAVNVELASNTEGTTTKASPTRCSTYVRTRVRGNTLMPMTLKVNLPSASIAEVFINMIPSTTSVPSFSNIISNHAMAAPGPPAIMFADAIEPVQCWPVNVIVVANKSLSVSLDTQGVFDDMLSRCIQSCSWPPFSCSWDAVPHRQQWPPPVQFGMQGGDVHLRPTPWPSFSSLTSWCSAYSVKKCLVQLFCCKISGEYWQHWYAIVEITVIPSIHLLYQYLASLHRSSYVHRDEGMQIAFTWEGQCDFSFPHIPSRYDSAHTHLLSSFVSLLACQQLDQYTLFAVLIVNKLSCRLLHKFTTPIHAPTRVLTFKIKGSLLIQVLSSNSLLQGQHICCLIEIIGTSEYQHVMRVKDNLFDWLFNANASQCFALPDRGSYLLYIKKSGRQYEKYELQISEGHQKRDLWTQNILPEIYAINSHEELPLWHLLTVIVSLKLLYILKDKLITTSLSGIQELPSISPGLVPEISVWNMELVWGLRSESRQQKRGGAFTEQIEILRYDFPNKSSSSIWDPGGLQLLLLVSMAGCVLTQEQVHWKCGGNCRCVWLEVPGQKFRVASTKCKVFSWELMLLDVGFLTTNKVVWYNTECLSLPNSEHKFPDFPWDPGGYIPSAWGQAESQGEGNVRISYGWAILWLWALSPVRPDLLAEYKSEGRKGSWTSMNYQKLQQLRPRKMGYFRRCFNFRT